MVQSFRGSQFAIIAATSVAMVLAASQGPAYAAPAESASLAYVTKADVAAQAKALDSDADGRPDRPDTESAVLAAQQLGQAVEDLSRRTPTTQVLANPNGTWSTTVSAAPVRAQDSVTGDWQSIDTTLVQSGDGWRPKVALGAITLSDGGAGPLATMTDVDGKDLSWTWPTELPRPTAEGNTLTYANVVPDGDLVVEATPSGFSESVVLRSAPTSALSLPLLIDTDGATIAKHADGSLSFRSKKDTIVAAPTPMMWDSKGPDGRGSSRPIATTLTTAGATTKLVLKPDTGYLADPGTTYPVTIDPTFGVKAAVAAVYQGGTFGYATDGDLVVDDGRAVWNGENTFLQFDQAALPKQGSLVQATLTATLTHLEDYCPVGQSDVTVKRVASAWDMSEGGLEPTTVTEGATNSVMDPCGRVVTHDWDVTSIANAWLGGAANYGVELTTGPSGTAYEQYANLQTATAPTLTFITHDVPGAPDAPLPSDSQTLNGTVYVRSATPSWSTSAVNSAGGNLTYTIEIHKQQDTASPLIASCTTGEVASGTTSSCTPRTLTDGQSDYELANGTYWVIARATDAGGYSNSGTWRNVTVNIDRPAPPTISCIGLSNGSWYPTRPLTSTTCTATSDGATQMVWDVGGGTIRTLSVDASGATSTIITLGIGLVEEVKVYGVSNAGRVGTTRSFKFGVGDAAFTGLDEHRTATGAFPLTAATRGVPSTSTVSAQLQYRVSNSTTDPDAGWIAATAVKTSGGVPFTGTGLNTSTLMTTTPDLLWTAGAEPDISAPSLLEVRMVFTITDANETVTTYTTARHTLSLSAHDATASGPSADFGAGSVDLISGEFATSATDVAMNTLAISRSHLSNALTATGAAGIFGPGWSAGVAVGGAASFKVTDQRAASASFVLQSPDGVSYVYQSNEAATTNLAGLFPPIGDAVALGATLNVDGASGVLTYTEQDGTQTTFERYAGNWVPTSTIGTSADSTTNYYYDHTTGLPTWIVAPAPNGVTCTPTDLGAGCAALKLNYTTVAGGSRVSSVDYRTWDPALTDADGDNGSDGLPDAAAGMSTTTVAKYAYNTEGTLQAEWDPRIADGTAALKTTYSYASTSGATSKTRITSITPPGRKPWQINYDADGAVTTITRPQDVAVATGNAIWTIRYGVPLNSSNTGLPKMDVSSTTAWGEPAADAPVAGAAVFGPGRVPAATPSADDWTYAQLYYWTGAGRLANTAAYGNNAWQIESNRYDEYGSSIWTLSASGRAQAIAEGAGDAVTSAAASNKYATWRMYNGVGDRIAAEYGPMITAISGDGTSRSLRSLTKYVYDDEADGSLTPGRPTGSAVPDGGFNVIVQKLVSATDEANPGAWAIGDTTPPADAPFKLYDTTESVYRYDPVVTGDPNGWKIRQSTQTWIRDAATSGGWQKTQVRYDSTGRVFQERTPQGVAENNPQQWHDTVYYTADGSASRAECRNRPEWAGLTCWDGPDQQPTTGQSIPSTSYAGYSREQAATRTITNGTGAAKKIEINKYDVAGRIVSAAITSSSTTDQPLPATITGYSPTTGQATTVSNGSMTATTAYDSWGRVISQVDGAGNTATTTYNAAGQVATFNDGKGTYTYGYSDTTAPSNKERRGMPTTLNTGVSGAMTTLSGVYNAEGELATENFPIGGTSQSLTLTQSYNVAGDLTQRQYVSTSTTGGTASVTSSQTPNVEGQVRTASENSRQLTYSYDARGRLAQATDVMSGSTTPCQQRAYTLSLDSDRKSYSATTYADPNCKGTSSTTSTTASYDTAHRITNAGYVYDDLGRTTSVPSAAINNPASGAVSESYYADDTVRTLTQGNVTQTYTLDALRRISTTITYTAGVDLKETTNHYSDSTDSPAWTETRTRPNASTAWTTTWTRYVSGLDGSIAMTQTGSSAPQVNVYNAHGDALSSVTLGTPAFGAMSYFTEFGSTRDGSASSLRYGWLAEAQRDSQGLGGIVLMGLRLYNPASGRFLSRDSIYNGNDNAYVYPADPVNSSDTSGACIPWCIVIGGLVVEDIIAAALAGALVIAGVKIAQGTVKAYGYTVPFPSKDVSNKGNGYSVYAIRYFKPNDSHGYIWKYGITGVGYERPQSQLNTCTARMKSPKKCTYEWRVQNVSKWQARALEATLIGNYLKAYHHCPPGHNGMVCT